jgi:hypothetical protein
MALACRACENEEKYIQGFNGENLSKGHCLEDHGTDGRKDIYSEYQNMVQLKFVCLKKKH